MNGICVAVNATTSLSGSSRNTVLKLWKSRPAAPMMRTRRRRSIVLTRSSYSRGRSDEGQRGRAGWNEHISGVVDRGGEFVRWNVPAGLDHDDSGAVIGAHGAHS